uniref:Syndecan binding protein 2 n=1 Tax=Apteryx owenii TaxID=8824 RepID=A0A8B9NXR3_APTOW
MPRPRPQVRPWEAAMATLYPSLEDMKGRRRLWWGALAPAPPRGLSSPSSSSSPCPAAAPALYPDLAALEDYMGLSLASEDIQKNLVPAGSAQALVPAGPALGQLVAPLSGSDAGLRRAAIKPGLREIHLCKDERGKTGLKLKNVDQGIFVQLVKANSPAALVGLRFGDQVLQLDGESCAGWSSGKAHKALKKASPEKIVMVVRDRPFQRTVTMHKDSTGHVGFVVKKGQIVSLAKDGSAARNGLLTHHYVCEVNGQNVIGLKPQKKISRVAIPGSSIFAVFVFVFFLKRHFFLGFWPGRRRAKAAQLCPAALPTDASQLRHLQISVPAQRGAIQTRGSAVAIPQPDPGCPKPRWGSRTAAQRPQKQGWGGPPRSLPSLGLCRQQDLPLLGPTAG